MQTFFQQLKWMKLALVATYDEDLWHAESELVSRGQGRWDATNKPTERRNDTTQRDRTMH